MSRLNGRSLHGFGALDEEMNGMDGSLSDFHALQDGFYEYGIEPEPYYYPPEEGAVGDGAYRKHLGPPQGIEPYAPSHQPIYQQTPEIQPMQYEITREHWKEYADIQNPVPVLEEENDWGATMISEEQLEYDKAKREQLTMRLPDELVTADPYGNYYSDMRKVMQGPKQGVHGLNGHLGQRPMERPLSHRERKIIVAKMAKEYIKQRLPQIMEFIEKRTPKRPIAALQGLGQTSAYYVVQLKDGSQKSFRTEPEATAFITANPGAVIISKPEPTFLDKFGSAIQKGIEILMPSAITYAAQKMEYKVATAGASALRAQYLPPPAAPPPAKPFYESPLLWIGAGAAALYILPKVLPT